MSAIFQNWKFFQPAKTWKIITAEIQFLLFQDINIFQTLLKRFEKIVLFYKMDFFLSKAPPSNILFWFKISAMIWKMYLVEFFLFFGELLAIFVYRWFGSQFTIFNLCGVCV